MLSRQLSQFQHLTLRSTAAPAVQRFSSHIAADVKVIDGIPTASVSWENARPFDEIPGPGLFEIVRGFLPGGDFRDKHITEMMKAFNRKYGPLIRFPSIFGKPPFLIAMNPDDYPVIFRNEGHWPCRRVFETVIYYREVIRKDFFKGNEGLTASNGEKWGKMRTLVNPILMQPKNAMLYLDAILEINNDFLERVRDIRDPKTLEMPDNFADDITNLAFEGIAAVSLNTRLGLIGKNTDSTDAQLMAKSIRRFFELAENLEIKPSFWKIFKTPEFHEMMRVQDTLTNVCDKYITAALERIEKDKHEEGKEKSVLEKLTKINKNFAVVMALDMLSAGIDTTSSTMIGILLCIAKHPEKQQKLFEELKTLLPTKDTQLSLEKLKNIPYLRACIKEGIRLYPIIPGTMRNLPVDVVLSGYRVPAGNDITIGANMLMQDERYVPHSKEFVPERWLRNDTSSKGLEGQITNPFMYVPFGFGPRMCAGKRIVNIELEVTIARLVRNFNIEFNYPIENAFSNKFLLTPIIPMKFKFEERAN